MKCGSASSARKKTVMRRRSRSSSRTTSLIGCSRTRALYPRTRVGYLRAGHARVAESLAHHAHGLGIGVDHHVATAELRRDGAERAAAGEEVKAPVAGAARGLHDAPHDALGLLRRVAGLLGAVR